MNRSAEALKRINHLSKQQKRIMDKLNSGVVLTNLEAWQSIGVYALSQRCGELINQKGYPIRRIRIKRRNRWGESISITAYDLAPENRNA